MPPPLAALYGVLVGIASVGCGSGTIYLFVRYQLSAQQNCALGQACVPQLIDIACAGFATAFLLGPLAAWLAGLPHPVLYALPVVVGCCASLTPLSPTSRSADVLFGCGLVLIYGVVALLVAHRWRDPTADWPSDRPRPRP